MRNVVINNRESLVQVQPQPTIYNKQGAPVPGEAITLLPGVNFVETELLKKLRENPLFDAHFKNKIPRSKAPEQNPEKVGLATLELVEVPEGKEGKKVPLLVGDVNPIAGIKDITVVQAILEETLVEGVLAEWAEQDSRSDVKQAIHRRIKELREDPEGGPAAAGR